MVFGYSHSLDFTYPSTHNKSCLNISYWQDIIRVTSRNITEDKIEMIAVLMKAPPACLTWPFWGFRDLRISVSQPLSPNLLLTCSPCNFCHCHDLVAQAFDLGVSCLMSPFPSSPPSSRSASLVHGISKIELFMISFLHLIDIILFSQLLTIKPAPQKHLPPLFTVLSNPRVLKVGSPGPGAATSSGNLLEMHLPGPPPTYCIKVSRGGAQQS